MFRWLIFVCGLCIISANPASRSIKTRIVGGKSIDIEDAPYQIVLHDVERGMSCGGSIIAPNYILTAGHCSHGSLDRYQVLSGSKNRTAGTKHKVVKKVRHEGYGATRKGVPRNDIAVMKVDPPFDLDGKTERVVELFEKDEEVEDGDVGFVTGWGSTSKNGKASDILKGLSVKFMPKSTCAEIYKSLGGPDKNQICATHAKGDSDFCNGDSGGPVVIDGRQAGLVSWSGPGCAISGRPGVYTEVAAYRDWIDEQIKN